MNAWPHGRTAAQRVGEPRLVVGYWSSILARYFTYAIIMPITQYKPVYFTHFPNIRLTSSCSSNRYASILCNTIDKFPATCVSPLPPMFRIGSFPLIEGQNSYKLQQFGRVKGRAVKSWILTRLGIHSSLHLLNIRQQFMHHLIEVMRYPRPPTLQLAPPIL